jgi:serine/threonine-protein kinase HipA
VEAAMLALAERCGIDVPRTRVENIGGKPVLLVRRFDREAIPEAASAYHRHRMVSALTVTDADDTVAGERSAWSYLLLADELQRWSARPAEDRFQLFRRMVFNALVSNTDDHPRNHALIAPNDDWRLAPAYDITPTPLPGSHERDLAMICGTFGRRARRANLLSGSSRFGIDHDAADHIVSEMQQVVHREWGAMIRRHGGTTDDCAAVAEAFDDEGFEYEQTD